MLQNSRCLHCLLRDFKLLKILLLSQKLGYIYRNGFVFDVYLNTLNMCKLKHIRGFCLKPQKTGGNLLFEDVQGFQSYCFCKLFCWHVRAARGWIQSLTWFLNAAVSVQRELTVRNTETLFLFYDILIVPTTAFTVASACADTALKALLGQYGKPIHTVQQF